MLTKISVFGIYVGIVVLFVILVFLIHSIRKINFEIKTTREKSVLRFLEASKANFELMYFITLVISSSLVSVLYFFFHSLWWVIAGIAYGFVLLVMFFKYTS